MCDVTCAMCNTSHHLFQVSERSRRSGLWIPVASFIWKDVSGARATEFKPRYLLSGPVRSHTQITKQEREIPVHHTPTKNPNRRMATHPRVGRSLSSFVWILLALHGILPVCVGRGDSACWRRRRWTSSQHQQQQQYYWQRKLYHDQRHRSNNNNNNQMTLHHRPLQWSFSPSSHNIVYDCHNNNNNNYYPPEPEQQRFMLQTQKQPQIENYHHPPACTILLAPPPSTTHETSSAATTGMATATTTTRMTALIGGARAALDSSMTADQETSTITTTRWATTGEWLDDLSSSSSSSVWKEDCYSSSPAPVGTVSVSSTMRGGRRRPGWKATSNNANPLPLVKAILATTAATAAAVWSVRHILSIHNNSSNTIASFWSLYALALLGSSIGFYRFFYFVSIGPALGILLPTINALVRYGKLCSWQQVSAPSVWHSGLVILWAVRLLVFLLWREHCAWPALHDKINHRIHGSLAQKVVSWVVYSAMAIFRMAPCWFRLENDLVGIVTKPTSKIGSLISGAMTTVGIFMQVCGLTVETLADWQKSRFKAGGRQNTATTVSTGSLSSFPSLSSWCQTGLWQYMRHPNYSGEWVFWMGTALASLPSIGMGPHSAIQGIMVGLGLAFLTWILWSAAQTLELKHGKKYGSDPVFDEYLARTSLFVPKLIVPSTRRRRRQQQ